MQKSHAIREIGSLACLALLFATAVQAQERARVLQPIE